MSSVNDTLLSNVNFGEYEAQHYGFSPRAYVDGVYNIIFDYFVDGISSLQKYLLEKFKGKVSEEKIRYQVQKNFTKTMNGLDSLFDKFEVYTVNNVLMIPSHVLLREDEVHRMEKSDCSQLISEIDMLHKSIHQELIKMNQLKEKLPQQNIYKKELMSFLEKLRQLEIEQETNVWKERYQLTMEFLQTENGFKGRNPLHGDI